MLSRHVVHGKADISSGHCYKCAHCSFFARALLCEAFKVFVFWVEVWRYGFHYQHLVAILSYVHRTLFDCWGPNVATRNAKYWGLFCLGLLSCSYEHLICRSRALFGVACFEVRGAKCELIFDTGQNKSQFLRHRMMDMNMKSVLGNEKITASTPAWGALIQWRNSRCRRWTGLRRYILYMVTGQAILGI